MNRYLFYLMVFCFGLFLTGCTSWGIARLPSKEALFVSGGSEDSFISRGELSYPYQPIGLVEASALDCAPCAGDMSGKYSSLEKVLNQQLVEKARREMGADAVIELKWSVVSSYDGALQIAAACPYGALMLPSAYLFNLNQVSVKGLAVKKVK